MLALLTVGDAVETGYFDIGSVWQGQTFPYTRIVVNFQRCDINHRTRPAKYVLAAVDLISAGSGWPVRQPRRPVRVAGDTEFEAAVMSWG